VPNPNVWTNSKSRGAWDFIGLGGGANKLTHGITMLRGRVIFAWIFSMD